MPLSTALRPTALRRYRLVMAMLLLGVLAGCAGGPQFRTLSARVTSEEPVTLPADATLEVQLKNETTGSVLASSRYERLGSLPIAVSLQYVPETIVADDIYRLRAQIRSDGHIIYLTPEPVPVFGVDTPQTPDIPIVTTGADATDRSPTCRAGSGTSC